MKGAEWEATLERIKRSVGVRDPALVALAVRVAADAAQLQARAAVGEDVSGEVKVVEASALNLSENARNVVGRELLGFLTSVLTKIARA